MRFEGSRVYGFKGLWVQGFMRFRRFEDSRVYGFKGLWVYGFMSLRV
jgi:hypothetical protein